MPSITQIGSGFIKYGKKNTEKMAHTKKLGKSAEKKNPHLGLETQYQATIFQDVKNTQVLKYINYSDLFNEIKTNKSLDFLDKLSKPLYTTNRIEGNRNNKNVEAYSPFYSLDIDLSFIDEKGNEDKKLKKETIELYKTDDIVKQHIDADIKKLKDELIEQTPIYMIYTTASKAGIRLILLVDEYMKEDKKKLKYVATNETEYKHIYKIIAKTFNKIIGEYIETHYNYVVDVLADISRANIYTYDEDARMPYDAFSDHFFRIDDMVENWMDADDKNEIDNEFNEKHEYKILSVDEYIDIDDIDFEEIMDKYGVELDEFFMKKGYIHHGNGEWFFGTIHTKGKLRTFLRKIYLRYYRGGDALYNFQSDAAFDKYMEQYKITTNKQKNWNSIFNGCGVPGLDKYVLVGETDETDEIDKHEFLVEKYISEKYTEIEDIIKRNNIVVLEAGAGFGKTKLILDFMKQNVGRYLFVAPKRMLLRQTYNDIKNDNDFNEKSIIRNWSMDENDNDISADILRYGNGDDADIYLSTLNSLYKLKYIDFDFVFIDEAHLLGKAIDDNKPRDYMVDFINKLGKEKIVFITATPKRLLYSLYGYKYEYIKISKKDYIKPSMNYRNIKTNDIEKIWVDIISKMVSNAKMDYFIFYNDIKKLHKIKDTFEKHIAKCRADIKVKIISSGENNSEIISTSLLEEKTIYLSTSVISEGININNKLKWVLIYIDRDIADIEGVYQMYNRFRDIRPELIYIKPPHTRKEIVNINKKIVKNNRFLIQADIDKTLYNYMRKDLVELVNDTELGKKLDLVLSRIEPLKKQDEIVYPELEQDKVFIKSILKKLATELNIKQTILYRDKGKSINYYEKMEDTLNRVEKDIEDDNIVYHNQDFLIDNKQIDIFKLGQKVYEKKMEYINGYRGLLFSEISRYFILNIQDKIEIKDEKPISKSDIKRGLIKSDFEWIDYKLKKDNDNIIDTLNKIDADVLNIHEILENDFVIENTFEFEYIKNTGETCMVKDNRYYIIVFEVLFKRFKSIKHILGRYRLKLKEEFIYTAYTKHEKNYNKAFNRLFLSEYYIAHKDDSKTTDLILLIKDFRSKTIGEKNYKAKDIKNLYKKNRFMDTQKYGVEDFIDVFCKTYRYKTKRYIKWDEKHD